MSDQKVVLGRGLAALLPAAQRRTAGELFLCPIDQLIPNPKQPRRDFDNIDALAQSIKEKGILQPLLVRKAERGYEVLAGERRLRAAKKLSIREVPVYVRTSDEEDALEVALIENLQREDLNPIEEAEAYRTVLDTYGKTQDELAAILGKERSTIANSLRLLKLPSPVLDLLRQRKLSAGHARPLLSLETAETQIVLAQEAVERGYSVRQMEALAKETRTSPEKAPAAKPTPERPAQWANWECLLEARLGSAVRIDEKKRRITIEFGDDEDVRGLLRALGCEEVA